MSKTFGPQLKKIMLKRIEFSLRKHLPELNSKQIDVWLDNFIVDIQINLFGKKETIHTETKILEIVQIPTTWWQHFKQTKFPKWLQKYSPPKIKKLNVIQKIEINETRVCPHQIVPKNTQDLCLQFLAPKEFKNAQTKYSPINNNNNDR